MKVSDCFARWSWHTLAVASAGALLQSPLWAQTSIITDGSWGRMPATLTPVATAITVVGNQGSHPIPGNVYAIAESQGKLAGTSNLFHSFERFSIGLGDAAVFTTRTPTIANVISRVSGRSATQINGLLSLIPLGGGTPNFFFINPAGVTFGAGAQVDVPGAFHVSTANRLQFVDGTLFNAGEGSDSTLTTAPPEAFGFLGTSRATVAMTGGTLIEPPRGRSLSAVGGDVLIDQSALITGDAGNLRVVAAGSDAVGIPLADPLPATSGSLSVVNNGFILSASMGTEAAGGIAVSAGDIEIDGRGSGFAFTGISSIIVGPGRAGDVHLNATRDLRVVNGGLISSESYAEGGAGSMSLAARNMTFDGTGQPVTSNLLGIAVQSGVLTLSADADSGAAGNITLVAAENLSVVNGAVIFSTSASRAKARPMSATAGSLTVDGQGNPLSTGIASMTNHRGAGADVGVRVGGGLVVRNGGEIKTHTINAGDAGSIRVHAGSIEIDRLGHAELTGIVSTTDSSGDAGNLEVQVDGDVSIARGAKITTRTFSSGAAGSLTLNAAGMTLDGKGSNIGTGLLTQANAGSSGRAGNLDVSVTGALAIADAGIVSSASHGTGASGSVRVAAESLVVEGRGSTELTGISTTSEGPSGGAGRLEVSVSGRLALLDGGQIGSGTRGAGNAGSIRIDAASVEIDGNADQKSGIFASAFLGSSGHAGNIEVAALGDLRIVEGGIVISTSVSSGNAGSITLSADSMTIEAPGSHFAAVASSTTGSGNAGDIDLLARNKLFIGVGGEISAGTAGTGQAASIKVRAGNVILDGGGFHNGAGLFSESQGPGHAGDIEVVVADDLRMRHGAVISTGASAKGDAGVVVVEARNIEIDGIETGITSSANSGSTGRAGSVAVTATGALSVINGGIVLAATESSGAAGSITVRADTVRVDASRIGADAGRGSAGQTGNVAVEATAGLILSNGGTLSIRNDATVADPASVSPTLLTVLAPSIMLKDAQITAESTGNVAASGIEIKFTDRLVVDPSSITTSADRGDGGDITIEGDGLIWLDHSSITTSTEAGNGGDISLGASILVLETGFIQANTGGAGTAGGNVRVAVQALVASGNSLSVANPTLLAFQRGAFGHNVIQAAAPSGVSGAIGITAPLLDIAGKLSGLRAEVIEIGPLGKDLCRVGAGSSLTPVGRGGLRPSAAALMRPDWPVGGQHARDTGLRGVPAGHVAALAVPADCRY